MSVKDRLKEYLAFKKISQRKFEQSIELSNGYVNNIVNSISPKVSERIALCYADLNVGWLLSGEGEMLKRPKNNFTQLTEKQMGDLVTEMVLNMYKKGEIYPAEVVDKMMAQKDEQIAELQKKVWELESKLK